MTIPNIKPNILAAVFCLALLFLLLPLAASINYYQNDDWCYYASVESFMKGVFVLHPIIAPSMYLQIFLGMLFSFVFGIAKLPILTLSMSLFGLYMFLLLLLKHFKASLFVAIIFGLIYYLVPIGVYEIWGFMSGHYFMPMLLSALYFFLNYENSGNKRDLIIYSILVFAGLLIRQPALVLPLSAFLFYAANKKWYRSLYQLGLFIVLYIFYTYVMPTTPRMLELPLQWQHFTKFDYAYSLVYGICLMLVSYTLPLVLAAVTTNYNSVKKILLFGFVAILAFIFLNKFYNPHSVSWGEFPYFKNVFERTGFYPRGILGTKYQFRGNFDLYKYWDLSAKILLALLIPVIIFSKKTYQNIYAFYLVTYIGVMVTVTTFFDRYILSVVPIFILFMLSGVTIKKWMIYACLPFVLLLGILAYQFSMDFLVSNKYVWNRSLALVAEKKVDPKMIQGTNAWKLTYRNYERNYLYEFSYDSPEINPDYKTSYNLVETTSLDFPLSIFINPKIYLYEKKL